MKLFRFLPLLLLAFTLFLSACGESEEEKQLKKISADQKAFVGKAATDVKDLTAALAKLNAENDKARNAAREMDDHLRDTQRAIGEVQARLDEISRGMNEQNAKIAREAEDLAKKQKGVGLGFILFVAAVAFVLVVVIVLIIKNRGNDVEDDDEDYSDYDAQDDDLGFGDDDLEDDLNGPTGPAAPTGPAPTDTK